MINSSEPCPYVRAAFSLSTPEQIDEVNKWINNQINNTISTTQSNLVFLSPPGFEKTLCAHQRGFVMVYSSLADAGFFKYVVEGLSLDLIVRSYDRQNYSVTSPKSGPTQKKL